MFCARPAEQALGRHFTELLVVLEPATFPDDLHALETEGPWSGIVALVPAEHTRLPTPSLAELARSRDGDTLELTIDRLSRLSTRVERNTPNTQRLDNPHSDTQRLHAILEHMPGFCYTVNADLVFTSSAGRGLASLNLLPGQVVGMNLLDMWGTRDVAYEPLRCHLRALAGIPSTYQDVCLGQSLEYRLQPLEDAAGNIVGVIGVGIDVTDRECAREERAKLTAQLRQAQKMEAVGRLAGGVAHDFNNFLTCIMGNLSLIEDHSRPGAESYLAEANAAVDSAATLTSQLLAFSRKQVISPRSINLSSLVGRIAGILERLVGERIELRTECAAQLWNVKADPSQLEQVLVNLVVNARDAISDEGEIVIQTTNVDLSQPGALAIEGLTGTEYVGLSVRDSGRGLSDVVRAKLFEPFFTTKETGKGTGLGLATVCGAVEQNGGTIRVESDLGAGTTFRIYLPKLDDGPSIDASAALVGSRSSLPVVGGTETILLVEDDPSVLELAHCTLQQLGYNVLPCASPDEALRTFGSYQSKVELLVTDVVMPRMNGKELASRISALRPGIPVLFSSGYGENIITQQGVLDTQLEFIGKPYRPRELAAKVRAVLDQRRVSS